MSRLHYNLVRTALDGAIDDTVTTFAITAPLREGGNLGSLIPTVGAGDVLAIRVDDEIMHVTAYTSGTTTITTVARGQDDTVADSHADAAVLKHVIAKADLGGASAALLGSVAYNPGTEQNPVPSSSSYADIDATNLAITFTVPASGAVLVCLSGYVVGGGTNSEIGWNLREGSSDVASSEVRVGYNVQARAFAQIKITGLTPGASKTYKWGHARTFGSGSPISCRHGGGNGAAVMTVWSA